MSQFQFLNSNISRSLGAHGSYDPFLVFLSIVAVSMAAYVALKVVKRLNFTLTPKSKRIWRFTGFFIISVVISLAIALIWSADRNLKKFDFHDRELRELSPTIIHREDKMNEYRRQKLLGGTFVLIGFLALLGYGFQFFCKKYRLDKLILDQKIRELSRFPDENPSPVLRISSEGIILYANEPAFALLDEFRCQVGCNITEEWQKYVQKSLNLNQLQRVEARISRKTFILIFTPAREFNYVNVYSLDITSLKEMEEKLHEHQENLEKIIDERVDKLRKTNTLLQTEMKVRQRVEKDLRASKEKAQEAARAKSNFLANMSHEIRTPLNTIVGFCDLLQKTSLDETQRKYINVLQSSGQLLCSVINGILDFSKLEAGKTVLETIDFNLHYLVHNTVEISSARINRKTVRTYITIDKNVSVNLKGDPTKLRHVLLNLMSNALKFTSQGEVGIIVKKEEERSDGGIFLRFTVKDTGVGIAQDSLEHIFEPFHQADTSITRKFGGTGLGLSITKFIVQAMGGKIGVRSEEGKGSEFVFTVLLQKGASAGQKEIYPLEIEKVAGRKILIVDDNQLSREILKKFCHSLKMEVIAVKSSGFAVLEELNKLTKQKNLPDLILSDIRMEGMSGFELAEQIRGDKRYAHIKIITLSSEAYAGQAHEARTKGFDGYLSKPFNNQDLVRVITTVFGDRREKGQIITRHMANELGCKGMKILVVEDNKPNQMLIHEYSKELGCESEFVENGQKAIEKLKESNKYHLVLMDLHMPVMGGAEACAIIRREVNKDIPIIALTAAVLEEDRENAKAAGMNDFLTKPIDMDDLRKKIIKYGRKA